MNVTPVSVQMPLLEPLRECPRCHETKPASEFTKENARKICKRCYNKTKRQYYRGVKVVRQIRRKELLAYNPEYALWRNAKQRARVKNVPFAITLADIVIPSLCPVLGIPIFRGLEVSSDNSPSLDRIIPEIGYVPGNVLVMSFKANRIKAHASIEELKLVLEFLQKWPSRQ